MNDLTEQFRQHKLPNGFYYIKLPFQKAEITSNYDLLRYAQAKDADEIKVLEVVPSYEKLHDNIRALSGVARTVIKRNEEIAKLKDLLKQCIPAAEFARDKGLADMINEALESEVLKCQD